MIKEKTIAPRDGAEESSPTNCHLGLVTHPNSHTQKDVEKECGNIHRSEAGPNYNSRELCTFFSTHQNMRDCKVWPIWDEIVTLLICFESRDMVWSSRFISLIIPSIIVTSARSSQAVVLQLMLETLIRLVSQPLQNISRHSLILTHCRIFPINTHYWRQLVILNNSHFSQNWM